MRTRAGVLAVVGLLAALTACGSDGGDGGDGAPSTTQTPTTVTSTTVAATTTSSATPLVDRLLTVADVGDGWRSSNPVNDDDLASISQMPCDDQALNPTIAARLRGMTGVQFEPADGAYRHLMELVLVGEPARLATDIDLLVEGLMACPVGVAGGLDRMEALALPPLGDQRAGLHYAATQGPGAVWDVRTATVRAGGRAVHLTLVEILGTPGATPTVTDGGFVALVTTAVTRLGR